MVRDLFTVGLMKYEHCGRKVRSGLTVTLKIRQLAGLKWSVDQDSCTPHGLALCTRIGEHEGGESL